MAGPRVPEFGKWDDQIVPYTVYFETAREGRNRRKLINPNDLRETPDLFSDGDSVVQSPTYGTKEQLGLPASRSKHELYTEPLSPRRRYGESPSGYNSGRAACTESTYQRRGGSQPPSAEAQKRTTRSSAGSESSSARPPLHQQAKSPLRGVGAPTNVSRQGNPGIPRTKAVSNSPDKAAAIPVFGEWNNRSPPPGDGYSAVFDKVRKDIRNDDKFQPGAEVNPEFWPSNNRERRPTSDQSSKVSCIPWCKKMLCK